MKGLLKRVFNKRFLILTALVACVVLSGCNFKVDKDPNDLYDQRNSSCWTCQFFGVVYQTLGKLSENTAPMLCQAATTLLVSLLALWLLYYLGKNFFWTLEEPDYRGVWSTVFKAIGKSMIVGIVLSSTKIFFEIVRMIYVPIVELWLFFALEVLKIDTGTGGLMMNLKNVTLKTNYSTKENVFPMELAQQIETILYRIQVSFDIGMTIGVRLLVMNEFTATCLALFVMGCFLWLSITFPLYFVDAVVRFGFGLIVLPLVLVAWAVPIQGASRIVATFFRFIMGTGAQFLIAAVFVSFSLAIMDNFLQEKMGFKATAAAQNADPSVTQEIVRLEGSGLLLFVLCFYLMKLSARVPSIAAKMTNTESGQCILESAIASVKQGIVAGVALIAGFFTAGAGTAVTLTAAAADKVGEVTSGGGGKGEE